MVDVAGKVRDISYISPEEVRAAKETRIESGRAAIEVGRQGAHQVKLLLEQGEEAEQSLSKDEADYVSD